MNIHDFSESKGRNLRQIMDFASAVNPLGLSNKAKHAIRKGIKYIPFSPDEKIRHLNRYICKKEQVREDNIMFAPDLNYILRIILNVFVPETVFLISPVSLSYQEVFNKQNIKIISLPILRENGFSIDIEELTKRINDADMILLSTPHDVTGAVLSMEKLARIIEETEKQRKMLLIDETYIEFTQYASPIQRIIESERAIILRTFNAFHALAGLPVAYGIGSTGIIKKLWDTGLLSQVGTLSYMAALASLKDKGYKERTQGYIRQEKQFIMEKMKDVNTISIFDTPCNFLLLNIRQPIKNLEDLLLERNILVDVYAEDDGGIYIRMPLKTHMFNARFIKALKNIINTGG